VALSNLLGDKPGKRKDREGERAKVTSFPAEITSKVHRERVYRLLPSSPTKWRHIAPYVTSSSTCARARGPKRTSSAARVEADRVSQIAESAIEQCPRRSAGRPNRHRRRITMRNRQPRQPLPAGLAREIREPSNTTRDAIVRARVRKDRLSHAPSPLHLPHLPYALLPMYVRTYVHGEFIVDNRAAPAGNNKAISGMEEILPAY